MFMNMGSGDAQKKDSMAGPPSFFPLRIHYGGAETSIDKQRRFYQKHKKSAKTLGLVVGCFCVCWLPFFLLYLIGKYNWQYCLLQQRVQFHLIVADHYCHCLPGLVLEFFTWLGYANSALNPIIYAVTMRSFGNTFKEMILQLLCHNFWASMCGFLSTGLR